MLVLLTRPLSRLALAFTPTSYFALGVLGLSVIASVSGDSLIKGLMAGLLGLMIATVGTDPVTGLNRFTFGSPELLSGIPPILVMVGLFAIGELLAQSGEPGWQKADGASTRIRFPSPAMWRRLAKPQAIGSVMGTIEGHHAGRRRHHLRVSCLQRGAALVASQGGIRQRLARRHCRARGGQQYGRLHGARADVEPRHPQLQFLGGPPERLPDARADAGPDAVREES